MNKNLFAIAILNALVVLVTGITFYNVYEQSHSDFSLFSFVLLFGLGRYKEVRDDF